MFNVFTDIKELLQMSKILKCIKNISIKSKTCNNPFEKTFIIIEELDVFATELNLSNKE